MGADVVIASPQTIGPIRPDRVLPDVMRQTIALAIVKNEQRSEAKADLLFLSIPGASPKTIADGKRSSRDTRLPSLTNLNWPDRSLTEGLDAHPNVDQGCGDGEARKVLAIASRILPSGRM
jgi:hypothetical protein